MSRQVALSRSLGFWPSLGIVIGITIGSGIFRTPASIAARVPDPLLFMAVWALGGVITLCGALSIAELAAALPHTGGLYVYLREGWGRLTAFLFGWAELVLIRASAVGALATVSSEYLLRSFGVDPSTHTVLADGLAAGAIVAAAAANVAGVRIGAAIVGLSTVAKFGALAALTLAAFLFGGGSFDHFAPAAAPVDGRLFGLALISVLWAYDGFADLSFAGGEVRDPQRTLPTAIIGGTLAIVAIYLSANTAYLYVNGVETIATSPLIAADTMQAAMGSAGAALVSVVVTISAFGALNGSLLGPPRVFFAMAGEGLFFRAVARVHPKYGTPYVAIAIAAVLGVLFVSFRTFEQLADTFVLSIWPFYAMAIAAVYRLRQTRPDLPRPYRTIGYPIVPAIFIAGVFYLVASALVTDRASTLLTFGAILAGAPVFLLFSRPKTAGASPS